MPRLNIRFANEVSKATQLAQAGELIRASSPPGSVGRKELTNSRLEALYETAYLRVFLAWEQFLEQTFFRYLCGQVSALGGCTLLNRPFVSIGAAEIAVLGGNDFVSWADPNRVIKRSQRFATGGFHEMVLQSDLSRLIDFKSVRNRIAHSSEHARNEFDRATRTLALRRYPGSAPGRFLRDRATVTPYPKTWLEVITDELESLAKQICS